MQLIIAINLLRFFTFILLILLITACNPSSDKRKRTDIYLPVKVEPMLISQLGAEHIGNTIYRRGLDGPRIAASGSRILEWPIQEHAQIKEVVPPGSGNYGNGACAMDINNDNIDEMIVGRSDGETSTDLLWFEEVRGQTQWSEHLIASIKRGRGDNNEGHLSG